MSGRKAPKPKRPYHRALGRRSAAWATSATLALACATPQATTLRVRADGTAAPSPFVSAYQYEHFILGERAMAAGEPLRAAGHFARARAGAHDDPLVQARHAEALAAADHAEGAQRILSAGLRQHPESEALHLANARIAERAGAYLEMRDRFDAARRALPESAAIALAYANALERGGDTDAATATLLAYANRATASDADALRILLRLAVHRGDLQAAVSHARTLLRRGGRGHELVVRTAEAALVRGKPDIAASLLDEVPPHEDHLAIRIRAWVAAGRRAEAESALALASVPVAAAHEGQGTLSALVERASLYMLVGRADIAVELLSAMLHPSPMLRRRLAEAHLANAEPVDAVRALEGLTDTEASALRVRALQRAGLRGLAQEARDRASITGDASR